jgi:SAM-dependent methyltransferase
MPAERRLTFGSVADLYDRSRPSYPGELVRDVIAYCRECASALEVGAGTGKATELFVGRGIEVHALEPSAEMAAFGRRRCPGVEFDVCDFETFDAGGRLFDLVFSAQAWHWVSPEVRYVKARALLRAGGALALFWNRAQWEENPLREALSARAYQGIEFGPMPGPMYPSSNTPPELWGDWPSEIGASPGFGDLEQRAYGWDREYSTAEYLEVIQTHSDHIMLGPERLGRLVDAVGAVIDEAGGRFTLRYLTLLLLARAV